MNNRITQMPPRYCKLCKDAGKPEAVYRSHCVRDRFGKTTCAYLLSLVCRRCNGTGHTQSHCISSAVQPVEPVRSYSRPHMVVVTPKKKKHRASNGFAALAELSSDEESDIGNCVSDVAKTKSVAQTPDEPKHWIKQSAVNWCDEASDDE
jgi:hypothetical protein